MLSPLWLGAADAIRSAETTRVHRAARRRGGGVAARGARAAGNEDASDKHPVTWSLPGVRPGPQHAQRLPARAARTWLHGGTEPRHRATICRWEFGSAPRAGR